ncbi:cell wall assembly and cell proliferation coordinating protein [Ascodesmis nigricans]|uniref:Cell wall assembly and cell proliferation coordinating protein n=1 Tax=Ascodesmis nigricans TaxID=341454 RepID=A0A4S2MWG8_9PEZI|nr:cell wall assembly and cell proliferation coordinating protein [Ascodesmis nigricans]
MAGGIGESFRSFWHAMTSNDRHASFDSPHRSLNNRPLSQGVGRNPGLTSVTSPTEGSLPYGDHDNRSTVALDPNGYGPRSSLNGSATSPSVPYTPGMRSSLIGGPNGDNQSGAGGIALQDFGADGMPPAPPVSHSWRRIAVWMEENYPELYDQLCTPASFNDISELEYSLDCTLPQDIRESWSIYDGQERGGRPTGVIFGCMLMDCEEILDEWRTWRVVENDILGASQNRRDSEPTGEAGPSSGAKPSNRTSDLLARQDCQPAGACQKAYAHAGWIPLARDWGGNYICVDLAPGPSGIWGQIILAGRDYDCKYVVAKSWAHFLAMVADDLQSPHWYVVEDSGDLKLKDPRAPRSEPSYPEILRVRNERKYGRKRFPRPNSRPGSQPGSQPGSPRLSAMPNGARRSGLTRPPKQDQNLSDNHLKPPSKKSQKAQLRSVTEEPTVPENAHTPRPKAAESTPDLLQDEDARDVVEEMAEVRLDDDDAKKKDVMGKES